MAKFQDGDGREWGVILTVAEIKTVKAETGVDLLEVLDGKGGLFMKLATDPILLVDTLYVLCKPQADERQVTDEDFGRLMGGDVLEAATDAMLEAIADFFPKRRREVLRQLIQKMEAVETIGLGKAAEVLEKAEAEALQAVQNAGD